MPKCIKGTAEGMGTNSACRSMTEGELRSVLDECFIRDISPKELATLADFETLSAPLKKIVKQMNKDLNGKINK